MNRKIMNLSTTKKAPMAKTTRAVRVMSKAMGVPCPILLSNKNDKKANEKQRPKQEGRCHTLKA